MSHQEKNTYTALASSLLLFGIYCWRIYILYQGGRFSGPDAASLLGKSFMLLVLIGIVAHIAIAIAFNFAHAVATRDPKPDFSTDERDRLIELKGSQAFLAVFAIGFIFAMGALALGAPPVAILFALIVAMFLGSIADDITKLFHYRRGF